MLLNALSFLFEVISFFGNSPLHSPLSLRFTDDPVLAAPGGAPPHLRGGHAVPGAVHVHRPGLHPPGHPGQAPKDSAAAPGQGSD